MSARRRELRKVNREKINARIAAWRIANPDKVREKNLARRARLRGAEGRVSEAEFRALCERFENRCLACGAGDVPLTRDHVVPLSKGGRHHISNIQPLCGKCNSEKGTAIIDYREGLFAVGG